jgi:very-short-patch-repair endonuclease
MEQGLHVMCFDNLKVLHELESVVASIHESILSRLGDT